MDDLMNLEFSGLMIRRTMEELRDCNGLSGRYGLLLDEGQMRSLAEQRVLSLQSTGRFEYGEGVLRKLVYAFCDSPHISQHNYAELLHELLESFYYFKNEALEQFSDDELIALMKERFDGVCQGSLEYLSGTTLEELCRQVRGGTEDSDEEPGWYF